MTRLALLLSAVTAVALAGSLHGQTSATARPFLEAAKLQPPAGSLSPRWGHALAADDGCVVVGDYQLNATESAVYVFERSEHGWDSVSPSAVLRPSRHQPRARFGESVAIAGDTIVVGARGTHHGDTAWVGAVYVYERPPSGWHDMTETALLFASDGAAPLGFGAQVATDGESIVVGAPGWSFGPSRAPAEGALYVFERPASGWKTGTENARLTSARGVNYSFFGNDGLAIDGDTIAACSSSIGVPPRGVLVYQRTGEAWSDMTETGLLASPAREVGGTVQLRDDTIVFGGTNLGPAAVHVFTRPASGWADALPTATLTPSTFLPFPPSAREVAFRDDRIAITWLRSAGAHIYDRPSTGWGDATEDLVVHAVGPEGNRGFGEATAWDDGALLVAATAGGFGWGSDDTGVVCIFDRPTVVPNSECGLGKIDVTGSSRRGELLNLQAQNPAFCSVTGILVGIPANTPIRIPGIPPCEDSNACLLSCSTGVLVSSTTSYRIPASVPPGMVLCVQQFCVRGCITTSEAQTFAVSR